MNKEKINEYLTLLRQLDQTSDCALHDALLDKLDYIWWKEFDEEDIDYVNAEVARSNEQETSTQEKPTMNNVFENKEDFLKLRDFWKQYHAEGRHKAVPVEYQTGWYDPTTKSYIKAYHMVSPLTLKAHLIYLAAMGRSLDKAIGNASPDTLSDIRTWLRYSRKSGFTIFEGSIDEKYHEAISARIDAYLETR